MLCPAEPSASRLWTGPNKKWAVSALPAGNPKKWGPAIGKVLRYCRVCEANVNNGASVPKKPPPPKWAKAKTLVKQKGKKTEIPHSTF